MIAQFTISGLLCAIPRWSKWKTYVFSQILFCTWRDTWLDLCFIVKK